MSEVAGRLAPQVGRGDAACGPTVAAASSWAACPASTRRRSSSSAPACPGMNAAAIALGMQAEVLLLDTQHRAPAPGRRHLPGPHADRRVERVRDRARGPRRRPGHRRGARARREGTEAGHQRARLADEARLGARRHRHRPGRLLRGLAPDDARRTRRTRCTTRSSTASRTCPARCRTRRPTRSPTSRCRTPSSWPTRAGGRRCATTTRWPSASTCTTGRSSTAAVAEAVRVPGPRSCRGPRLTWALRQVARTTPTRPAPASALARAADAYLDHLTVERGLARNTELSYRRDLRPVRCAACQGRGDRRRGGGHGERRRRLPGCPAVRLTPTTRRWPRPRQPARWSRSAASTGSRCGRGCPPTTRPHEVRPPAVAPTAAQGDPGRRRRGAARGSCRGRGTADRRCATGRCSRCSTVPVPGSPRPSGWTSTTSTSSGGLSCCAARAARSGSSRSARYAGRRSTPTWSGPGRCWSWPDGVPRPASSTAGAAG